MVDGFAPRRPQPGMHPGMPAPQPVPIGAPTLSPQQRPIVHAPVSGPSPALQPAHMQPTLHQPAQPLTAPMPPAHAPMRPQHPVQPRTQTASQPQPAPAARPMNTEFVNTPAVPTHVAHTPAHPQAAPVPDTAPPAKGRGPREKSRTGHAGLVGFIVFILLGALLVSPLLPGKIMDDFPLASNTYSAGDSGLNCIGKQGKISSTTKYDTKAGVPITYTYATSTTQTATCDGQTQNAVVGRTSQFNPLGLIVDIIIALIAAIIVARIWRLIFGEKRHSSRHNDN